VVVECGVDGDAVFVEPGGRERTAIVEWRRGGRADDESDEELIDARSIGQMPVALVDAWLLREFPGRTLEELDGMDFGRLWRALAVRGVLKAEEARELQLQGKHTPTPEEWRAIRRNDRCQRIMGAD
jgi:hypothetical protein